MNGATCEVAVDTETGEVEIIRFGVVADTGKVLRRTSLESQIHQVMDFTQGCQLQEEFIFDPKTGVRLSTNMFEYKKVRMLDMARVDLDLPETRGSNACYGASGISHSLANTHLVIMPSTTRSASGSNRRRRPTGFSKPSAKHKAVARFPLKIGVVCGKRATRYGKPIGVIPRKKDTDILLSQKPGLGL
jgi:hypothetical protein